MYCHDMAGGYLDTDVHHTDVPNLPAFRFHHWELIDTFVYFSHHFITIPPLSWINLAHSRNVKVYGTFIIEQITEDFKRIFMPENQVNGGPIWFAEQLYTISQTINLEGWLINIESCSPNKDEMTTVVSNLELFLRHLKSLGQEVVWYDALTSCGSIDYQNALTEKNKRFFDSSTGLFTNYLWDDEKLKQTQALCNSPTESSSIFVGVDCFGRGCMSGGRWNTHASLDSIIAANRRCPTRPLSVAIFAPGWCFEHIHGPRETLTEESFILQTCKRIAEADDTFWLENLAPKIRQLRGNLTPISFTCSPGQLLQTNFCSGFGIHKLAEDGIKLPQLWSNMHSQQITPTFSPLDDKPRIFQVLHEIGDGFATGSGSCPVLRLIPLAKHLDDQLVFLELFTFDRLKAKNFSLIVRPFDGSDSCLRLFYDCIPEGAAEAERVFGDQIVEGLAGSWIKLHVNVLPLAAITRIGFRIHVLHAKPTSIHFGMFTLQA